MAREQAPAFQFYVRDWLASGSVAVLSLDERGAYITLMARCWLMVELPLASAELAALALTDARWWTKHGDRVLRQFTKTETGYRHDRLDEEREKQAEFSGHQSDRAVAGWRKRRAKSGQQPGNAGATPGQCHEDALHSASASASSEEHVPATPASDGFEDFWNAYPKKLDRLAALKAWRKLKPSPALQEIILQAVASQSTWLDWRKDRGQFIPYAATWLNHARWDDEAEPETHQPVTRGTTPSHGCDWCDHHPRCESPEHHAIKARSVARRAAQPEEQPA